MATWLWTTLAIGGRAPKTVWREILEAATADDAEAYVADGKPLTQAA